MHEVTHLLLDLGNTLIGGPPGQSGSMADWPDVYPAEGAAKTLAKLSDVYPIHVATGAGDMDRAAIRRVLGLAGLDAFIQDIFIAGELGLQGFDPAFYTAIARKLGVGPGHILMTGGDYQGAIMPASVAGMRTILVETAQGRYPEAEAVIPSLAYLPFFIEV